MRSIITGATSMIGLALVNELLTKHVEMLLLVRKTDKVKYIPKSKLIKIKYCNIDEYDSIKNISNDKYDVLYHIAWASTTGSGREDLYLQNNNVKYSLDAVNLANRFNCKCFIGFGSQAEFGQYDIPLNMNLKDKPIMGYGIAKLSSELMTRSLCNKLGIKHIWTRILSVYGPYDRDNSLIMHIINSIKNNEEVNVTKGEQVWDYIYSKDVASILYLLYKKGINNKTYLIGSADKYKLKDYVEIIKNSIDKDYIINYGAIPYNEKQTMFLSLDNSDLINDLNYKYKYDFESGIKDLLEWYDERDN